MSAPPPLALELLVHELAEAYLRDLTTAYREVAMVRAATAAERRDLETMLEQERGRVKALEEELEEAKALWRRSAASLDALLQRSGETPKPAKVSTTLPNRQAVGGSVQRAPTTNEGAKSEPVATYQRRGRPTVDLTGVKVGNFVGIEKTRERGAGGAVVWLFRCELCGSERAWTNSHVAATKRARMPGRCSCQGGPKVIKAPILRQVAYKPQTDGLETAEREDLGELDTGIDDVDSLLSRAMREAEGDGRIRSLAARAARPRNPERDEDEEPSDEDEKPEPGDEDADEDDAEELDFEP